jgi:FMN reductase
MNTTHRIPIVTVIGSSRPGSYTAKAVALVDDEIRQHRELDRDTVDLATITLPLPGTVHDEAVTQAVHEKVRRAAGVILATPEYHGTFSSAIKLFIENLGFPSALARKPIALLGVAAVLPGPVSVANVREMFDEDGRCLDEAVEKRVRGTATSVIDYIKGYVCPSVALEEMVRERTA